MRPGHYFAEGQRVGSVDGRCFGAVVTYGGDERYVVEWDNGTTNTVHKDRLRADPRPANYGPAKRVELL